MYLNKRLSYVFVAFFLLAIALPVAFSESYGCCCNPSTRSGNIESETSCSAKSYLFTDLPARGLTCNDVCDALILTPRMPVCGDKICEGDEAVTCPSDCVALTPEAYVCGSPDYLPAPTAFIVSPVKGEKAFRLSFSNVCPPAYVDIWRNRGGTSDVFDHIAKITGTEYTDLSESLEWNKDYIYEISSYYIPGGESESVKVSANMGDIECWNNMLDVFCLSPNFYYQFENYLKEFGYKDKTDAMFKLSFEYNMNETFDSKYNDAYSCSDLNKIVLKKSCDSDEACAIRNDEGICIEKGSCENNNLFGLFSTANSCEKDEDTNISNFCFFDASKTVVDSCFDCVVGMDCYDYKSQSACVRDNCGVGSCEWHDVIPDLGVGVCVDTRKSNCDFCNSSGSRNIDNEDSYNGVFNSCSDEKASALSVSGHQCFYDRDFHVVKTCEEVNCRDYTRQQCNSPSNGINLDNENNIISSSLDPCGIGVCQYDSVNEICRKNADGDKSEDWADCPINDYEECESDYIPPLTSIIPSGQGSQVDFLNIILLDKQSPSGSLENHAGESGYETFVCVETSANSCNNPASFKEKVSSSRLILKNLDLKDGQDKLARLKKGKNKLFFYSKDEYDNVETVKSVEFSACDNCQGPTLLNVSITGGKLFGSSLYSGLSNPIITLVFDEPTKISSASLTNSPAVLNYDKTFRMSHTISFSTPLSESSFRLSLDVVNEKNIHADPKLFFTLVIDSSLGSVDIIPEDGTILPSGNVNIRLEFSKYVSLEKVVLKHLSAENKYLLSESEDIITGDFITSDNEIFPASFSNLNKGTYRLFVQAEDRNDMPIAKETGFFVSGVEPFVNLRYPSFGISPTQSFKAEIISALKSECRYVFDVPEAPSESSFSTLPVASSNDGYVHQTITLDVPFGFSGTKSLYVFCKNQDKIYAESFDIEVDSQPPLIVNAYAFPDVISEEYYVGEDTYGTYLKVETDKPSFCRYSSTTNQFDLMENDFDGFGVNPKNSHSELIFVDVEKTYTYFVACENAAGVASSARSILFDVDLDADFSAEIVTSPFSNSLNFSIGVQTNKRSLCYLGKSMYSISSCFGDCTSDYVHRQEVIEESDGNYEFFIKCVSSRTGESSGILKHNVIIDNTPPEMLWVNVSSLLSDSQISYFDDRIRLAFLGDDNQTGIAKYLVTVKKSLDDSVILNRKTDVTDDGTFHYVTNLSLSDDTEYDVLVEAVDKAGLISDYMEGESVFTNFSLTPSNCRNGVKDGSETDVDCGGDCHACDLGESCKVSDDCESDVCYNKICVESNATCDNGILDGSESDVDCGGSCPRCDLDEDCYDDSDCESHYCSVSSGTCKTKPACEDNKLSYGETDIDCGGPCLPCSLGENCEIDSDCSVGLSCKNSVCVESSELDKDQDGVLDIDDICPNTPVGESVDINGCGDSQKYSVGDIIDDGWRLKYFGCIDCSEAAADYDADDDGLTNIQEFQYGTNPVDKDTDNDGWTDLEEIEQGTNPLDSSDEPEGGFSFFNFFLIVLIIAAAGVGGYLVYKKLKERGLFKQGPKMPKLPEIKREVRPEIEIKHIYKPKQKPKMQEDKMEKLRQFAKKKEVETDWIDLAKPKQSSKESLDKLRSRLNKNSGLPKKGDLSKLRKSFKSDVDAFEKLKKRVEENKRKKK